MACTRPSLALSRLPCKVSTRSKHLLEYPLSRANSFSNFPCIIIAVFTRTPCKTLDVGIITYILSQASTNHETIKELKKPKRTLKLYSTSSVFSNDGKTYVRLLKTTTTSTSPSKRPLAVHSQESQVSISPVQAFYDEQPGVVPPASHNAVLSDMTPYMRHKLKARRMRGGALSPGLQDRLTVGFYFAAWYALNIVYNSKFLLTLLLCDYVTCSAVANTLFSLLSH